MAIGATAINPVTGEIVSSSVANPSSVTGAAFSGEVSAPSLKATGTTGAPLSGRYVGVIASGPPTAGTYAVGDFCLSQNGQMFVCVTAGTPGTWVTPRDTRDLLTVGEETFDRLPASSTSQNPSSGQLRLTFFTARKSETTTQVRLYTGTTAAGATPTLCRIAMYEVDSSGNGTLVASTANDTSLFGGSPQTGFTRSWTAPYAKVAGRRYAIGPLVVTGATMPTFQGATQQAVEGAVAPRINGLLSGLSDIPSSFTEAGLNGSGQRIYMAVLP